MNRLIDVKDEMLLPLRKQLKEALPDSFFTVEEGFKNGEKIFWKLKFLSDNREEALEWINAYKTMIIRREKINCSGERFWTEVFDYVGIKRKPLGDRAIISGVFFYLSQTNATQLAMRVLDQF